MTERSDLPFLARRKPIHELRGKRDGMTLHIVADDRVLYPRTRVIVGEQLIVATMRLDKTMHDMNFERDFAQHECYNVGTVLEIVSMENRCILRTEAGNFTVENAQPIYPEPVGLEKIMLTCTAKIQGMRERVSALLTQRSA